MFMNREYVENLERPNNDPEMVKLRADKLIKDVFPRDLVEYTMNTFLEATEAYYDDYDSKKLYYILELNQKMVALCFDVENLAHIFGIPNGHIWQQAVIINKLIENRRIPNDKWLSTFKQIFSEFKEEILAYETDKKNEDDDSLNWDKIAEKVFCFLNLGVLSEGDTVAYREKISRNKDAEYVLSRDVISKGINGKIMMLIVPERDGSSIMVPKSIVFEENVSKKGRPIRMGKKDYIFDSFVTINQVRR